MRVETDLDAAVRDFAERFRKALEPPAFAAATIDRAALAAHFDEPLPEHGTAHQVNTLVTAVSPGKVS
jgi:hypothetical protein